MLTINPFTLPPFLSAVLILFVALHVLFKNKASKTNRAFFYFCLSLFVWLFSYSLIYSSPDSQAAYRWAKVAFLGVGFISFTNFYFYITALNLHVKKGILSLLLSSVVGIVVLSQTTPYIYESTQHFFWGFYTKAGKFHTLFLIHWVIVWSYGLWLVFNKMQELKKSGDYIAYNRAKYLFLGYIGECLGFVDFLPKYGVPVYPFGYISTLYWVLIVSFTLLRQKMLADISFLTRRVVVVSGTVVGAALIFAGTYFAVQCIGKYLPFNASILLVVISLATGFAIQPLYLRIRALLDKTFFPEYFERKEKLVRFGQEILLSKDVEAFNRTLLDNIFSSFKIVKTLFFFWNQKEKAFILQAGTGLGEAAETSTNRLELYHVICKYLMDHDHLLLEEVRSDFYSNIDQRPLELAMLKLDATICVPIRSSGGNLLGILVLGEKESGLPYASEDIKTLKILAGHTAIALENIDLTKRWSDELNQNQQLFKILHRYMGPSIADEILRKADHSQNGKGERKYATILVADIRRFMEASESNSPEEVVRSLNEYFSEMIEIILSHGGTVYKFMGESILVSFGAPSILPNSEDSALFCAMDMQKCLTNLNRNRNELGLFSLGMGIGICSGDVVIGNIGSDRRMEYTVIGNPVNIAALLQATADSGKILVTTNILDKASKIFESAKTSPITIKGKSKPIDVFEIVGLKTAKEKSNNSQIIDFPITKKNAII